MLEPPSPSVCLNCLSHPRLLGGGGGSGPLGRWSFRGPGQETPAAVAAAEDTPKRNTAHSRATGSLPLPDLSQQEVSGFSRKHARARTDRRPGTPARAHAPPQTGRPGEPRTPAGRGSATLRLPGTPGFTAQGPHVHWIPKAGTGQFQHAHQASSAPARLLTAFRAPKSRPPLE